MKKLILITLFFANSVFAFPVPKELVDAEIIVKTRDGLVYKFSANEYKVVKRTKKVEEKKSQDTVEVTKVKEETSSLKRNRISLLGGAAPSSELKLEYTPGFIRISSQREYTFGINYQRLITDRVSLGATVLSNETYLLGVGFDF